MEQPNPSIEMEESERIMPQRAFVVGDPFASDSDEANDREV